MLQQPRAPLEGVSLHFSNMYYIILKEDERYSSWIDVTKAAGPILLRLGRATKMAVVWSYFVGVQKIGDLSESKNFFAEVFQIKSRFVLAKKNLGG